MGPSLTRPGHTRLVVPTARPRARARGGCVRAQGHARGDQRRPWAHGGTVLSPRPARRAVSGSPAAGHAPVGCPRPTTSRSRARPGQGATEDRTPLQPSAAGIPLPKRQRQSREASPRQPHTPNRHDSQPRRPCARTGHAQRSLARPLKGWATRADSVPASRPTTSSR